MSAKTYLRILRGGIIASLLVVFFVFSNLLFPYITSKQLPFNILMEFLLVIWVVFIWRYPQYRPKKSYLTWGLIAYFLAILVTSFTGVNFTLSFWGNAERMLGFFSLIHYLIFYLVLITAFRSWKEWRILFMSSVIIAVIVSLRFLTLGTIPMFKHLDVYSTIGNTAYVSGYLIFNIFFSFILWLRSEQKLWRWLYAIGVLIMLSEFWAAHTSGAIIGLFLSILLLFLLLGFKHKRKLIRRWSVTVLLLAIITVVAVFSQYQAVWFQHSFLKNLTPEKTTFQTRLISWRSAADDFQYHPWLGVGLGNYAIIFDKHFNSSFYNYATSGTYFDRAHNNLIDIVSTTGLLGLITYLSIFVAVLYYLFKRFKDNGAYAGTEDYQGRKNLEIIIIIALLTAYFIQNLAVFDSLVTYVGLMLTFGFIYYLVNEGTLKSEGNEIIEQKISSSDSLEEISEKKYFCTLQAKWEWPVLIILILATYLFASQYNVKPWRMFTGSIQGYGDIINGNFAGGLEAYQQALIGTPLDHDARVTLINLIDSNARILKSLPKKQAGQDLDYVISLAEKNVDLAPRDSLSQMQLAQTLEAAARFNYQNPAKFKAYSDRALQAIDRSIAASPGRATVYLAKAQILLLGNKKDKAIQTAEYAVSLNPHYYAGYCRLAQFYAFWKDQVNMGRELSSCFDRGGASSIRSNLFLANAVSYFASQGNYEQALIAGKRLQALNPRNAQVLINLARLYLITGHQNQAELKAQEAIIINPKLKTSWSSFQKSFTNLNKSLKASSRPAHSSTTTNTSSSSTSPAS